MGYIRDIYVTRTRQDVERYKKSTTTESQNLDEINILTTISPRCSERDGDAVDGDERT
jgi:hypothetical protein